MIRTLALIWAPNPDYCKDDKNSVAENACDEVVMVVVGTLGECSPHVSQQHRSDLSLKAIDHALTRFYLKIVFFENR